MPSSITLTVSHLPTSTSFFLSALQPLNYAYRGRSGQTVGFGPTNSSVPADFWLTQEVPGVPAGAAHVAFPATSRSAVQDFFASALRAGGKIHGEPCLRDASGYYSAAIIDFDGNSIEAVYRPSLIDNLDKENSTVVSKRSMSKAPSVVSRAPSSASQARSVALTQASTSVPQSPARGDVLENLLTQARSTADVARQLVQQVRPNLHSSQSTPAALQPQSGSHDAVVGTLLGVAAGAALSYAFASRKSSPSSDEEPRGRRPSMTGRSATMPQYSEYNTSHPSHHSQRAIDAPPSLYSRGGGRYITMEDNDYASTVRPGSVHSRRRSIDSGIGISPPSSASKASKKSTKMLDAPPSAYKAPSVLTLADTQASKKSKRSSSLSRAPSRQSSQSRRRSSSASRDAQTVLHIQEFHRVETLPDRAPSMASTVKKSTASIAKQSTASTAKQSTASAAKQSTVSTAKQSTYSVKSKHRSPEDVPLPISRAATWADGHGGSKGSEASFMTAKSGKTIMGLEKIRSEAGQKDRDMTKSVVGKLREGRKLDLPAGEVGPEDSVSQVSSSRGSRRSSRR